KEREPANWTSARRAPEIRRRDILPFVDDGAADRAGAGEPVEQRVAVAVADRLLERIEVAEESSEHVEHGLAVRQEDVAPHRRVGRGDAREIAKSAGRTFAHLAFGDGLAVRR